MLNRLNLRFYMQWRERSRRRLNGLFTEENVRLQSPLCGGSHYANAIFYYRKRGAPPRGLVRALEKAAEAKRQLTLRTARSIDARLKLSRSAAPRSNPKGSGHSHSVRRRNSFPF